LEKRAQGLPASGMDSMETLALLYLNNWDIQDEMIVGKIWGKTPY